MPAMTPAETLNTLQSVRRTAQRLARLLDDPDKGDPIADEPADWQRRLSEALCCVYSLAHNVGRLAGDSLAHNVGRLAGDK